MNLLILYWSQTGNTEKMAQIIKKNVSQKDLKSKWYLVMIIKTMI